MDYQFCLWQNNGKFMKKNKFQARKQQTRFFKIHQLMLLIKCSVQIMQLFMKLNQFQHLANQFMLDLMFWN